MTIDEAIKHFLEVAEQSETRAQNIDSQLTGKAIREYIADCRDCAAKHRQLVDWLVELKDLRANQNDETIFIEQLLKENTQLKEKICNGDLIQIGAIQAELDDAKRLLRLAVDDIYKARQGKCCSICNIPKDNLKRCEVDFDSQDCKFIWKYSDNVEWLLNEGKGTSDLQNERTHNKTFRL